MIPPMGLCKRGGRMATRAETVAHLTDILPGTTAKQMFGEYGFYLGPKLVGLICDDQLFLRPYESARALLPDLPLAPPLSLWLVSV